MYWRHVAIAMYSPLVSREAVHEEIHFTPKTKILNVFMSMRWQADGRKSEIVSRAEEQKQLPCRTLLSTRRKKSLHPVDPPLTSWLVCLGKARFHSRPPPNDHTSSLTPEPAPMDRKYAVCPRSCFPSGSTQKPHTRWSWVICRLSRSAPASTQTIPLHLRHVALPHLPILHPQDSFTCTSWLRPQGAGGRDFVQSTKRWQGVCILHCSHKKCW